jgi:5-formyltetrahydrofolate cyclo-ligase
MSSTKIEIRKEYKHKRKELAPGQLQTISDQIAFQLFSNFQLARKFVSLFLPIERQFEINTYQIWEKAREFGAQVAIPTTNLENLELKHILFESEEQLTLSAWGIPEPNKGKIIPADKFDFVFVPLLAADLKGNRVGYGKGFYDHFLAKCSPNCQFIGLSHFDLIPQIEDVRPGDIRLHACITPTSVIHFER